MANASLLATEPEDITIEQELADKLAYSKRYMQDYKQNHWEYVKLKSGKPINVVIKKNERGENLIKPLTTGSLCASINKLTRQVVQGAISVDIKTSHGEDTPVYWLNKYIIENIILTDSTTSTSNFVSKIKRVFSDSLAFGFCPVYTAFEKNLSGEPVVKMKLRDYGNVFPEPDKDHISEINWCFTRLWYSKSDIDSMRGVWDDDVCDDLIKNALDQKMGSSDQRDSDDLNISYAWQQGYPIYVYQEKNKDSDIIYYSERLNKIIYRHKNFDDSGMLRTHFFVNNADSSGALGRSLFENLKIVQEAEDEELQLSHWSTTLELDPPFVGYGNADSPIYMRRAAMNWMQQGGSISPMRTTNQSPQVVASSMQMLAGIITNETGVDDMSTPSTNNQAGLSKTDTGIKQQKALLDTVTNSYDEELKAFIADYIMNAYNIFLKYSKAAGIKTLAIKDYKTLQNVQSFKKEDNIIEIPYEMLGIDGVSINVGTTDFGTTGDKVDAIREILNIITSSQGYNPATVGYVKSITSMLNLDDSDEVQKALDEWASINLERQNLNNRQTELQLKQMELQLRNAQQGMPAQIEQMKVQTQQGQMQEATADLQLEAQRKQLQLQIAQMTQQLEQLNNPQAQQQQPMQEQQGGQNGSEMV